MVWYIHHRLKHHHHTYQGNLTTHSKSLLSYCFALTMFEWLWWQALLTLGVGPICALSQRSGYLQSVSMVFNILGNGIRMLSHPSFKIYTGKSSVLVVLRRSNSRSICFTSSLLKRNSTPRQQNCVDKLIWYLFRYQTIFQSAKSKKVTIFLQPHIYSKLWCCWSINELNGQWSHRDLDMISKWGSSPFFATESSFLFQG